MSGFVQVLDHTNNFWKQNPSAKSVPEFLALYDTDKGKSKSSVIMWAIAYLLEPGTSGNPWAAMPEDERKERLVKEFLKDPSFRWDDKLIKDATDVYERSILTQAERSFRNWERKMEERDGFIAQTPYDSTTFEMLDKMMAATSKMYDQLNKVRKDLEDEFEKTKRGKGDKVLSLTDSDDI